VKLTAKITLLAILLGAVSSVARADLYETAYFSAELIPVTGSLAEVGINTDLISGNFVSDEQLIPGPASGLQSVAFNSTPAIAEIPPATAFQMTLGGMTFNQGDFLPGTGGIVYNNGQFDGFDGSFDFFSNGQEYRFVEQGTAFEIELLVGNTAVIVVAGTIDFNPLFDIQPYAPTSSGLGLNTGGIGTGNGGGNDPNGSNPFSNDNPSPPGNNSPPSDNNSPPPTITINPPGNNNPPSGNNNPSPVPEPGMFWVLAGAMISLGARVVIVRRRSVAVR
jgi:hypothetical protein